jgi:hypothetical protein
VSGLAKGEDAAVVGRGVTSDGAVVVGCAARGSSPPPHDAAKSTDAPANRQAMLRLI